jgi:hypothetical protein
VFVKIFNYENLQFLFLSSMGKARSPIVLFGYTVALTAVTKAETLVF